MVIASIHQPSTATFELFDRVCVLSKGVTCFYGPRSHLTSYFDAMGHPIPTQTNPVEFILDLVNTDFTRETDQADKNLLAIQNAWQTSVERGELVQAIPGFHAEKHHLPNPNAIGTQKRSAPIILLHRNFIKSYRDILAYGTRIAMYFGLAILMGKHSILSRSREDADALQVPCGSGCRTIKPRYSLSSMPSFSAAHSCLLWPSPISLLRSKTYRPSAKIERTVCMVHYLSLSPTFSSVCRICFSSRCCSQSSPIGFRTSIPRLLAFGCGSSGYFWTFLLPRDW